MQHYVIEFVSDLSLAADRWFSPDSLVSSTNKTNCHDIAEILLKVTLNTIPPPTISLKIISSLCNSVLNED
jgi:hypothetical protein